MENDLPQMRDAALARIAPQLPQDDPAAVEKLELADALGRLSLGVDVNETTDLDDMPRGEGDHALDSALSIHAIDGPLEIIEIDTERSLVQMDDFLDDGDDVGPDPYEVPI